MQKSKKGTILLVFLIFLLLVFLFFVFALTELELWLDFHLMHLVGIGERELQNQIRQTAFQGDIAIGYGAITLNVGNDVFHFDISIANFLDISIHMAYRQLATFLFTHDCGSTLGNVDFEIS